MIWYQFNLNCLLLLDVVANFAQIKGLKVKWFTYNMIHIKSKYGRELIWIRTNSCLQNKVRKYKIHFLKSKSL